MFTRDPFAELSASISPAIMQTYVIVMVLLVIVGTLFDIVHKGSATVLLRQLAERQDQAQTPGRRRTSWSRSRCRPRVVDVAASGEFCNPRRRVAHLLGDVRLRPLRGHHGGHGVRLSHARHAGARPSGRRCGGSAR